MQFKRGEMRASKIAKILVVISLLCSVNLVAIVPAKASFDASQAAYYEEVKSAFSLTPEQEQMLAKYGFVIAEFDSSAWNTFELEDVGFHPELRFEDFYFTKVYGPDLPVFITTDSILHLFHVVFDCSLKIIEKQALYAMALDIAQFAYQTSLNDYQSTPNDGSLTYWAVRNSTVYFAVALSLLTGETVDVPAELSEDLNFFLDNIYSEEPEFIPAVTWIIPVSPPVAVSYDFTQFTVRGHYLGDTQLEQYFRALMWFGRFPLFVPRNDEKYEWSITHFDDVTMVYMRDLMKSNPQYYDKWKLLYDVTSALVGESDSINLINLETALHNVFGEHTSYLDYVVAEGGLSDLRDELGKPEYSQQILSQALIAGGVLPRYPVVYQFMGQRYVPDSYMFQKLCWDQVEADSSGGRRILPKGLDVFAVLGSERAYGLLSSDFGYQGFKENLEHLTITFASWEESDWNASSYTDWMYALESLVQPTVDGYPEFMQSDAWQDEKLNTALGSWSQLRHDTILYAKQTYIPALVCSYPEAFVEPNPTFYSRMQDLCERTIEAMRILEQDMVNPVIITSLQTLKDAAQKLEVISEKELAEWQLTQEEIDFIKTLVYNCGSGGFRGWYVDTIHAIAQTSNSTSILEAPVIADVATFPPGDIYYPPQILHVGTGYVNALVVLFPKIDGTLVAAVGPVFSYYEFKLIGTERLNDVQWLRMLTWDNRTSYLPDWLQDVYGRATPRYPENFSGTMLAVFMALSVIILVFRKRNKAKIKVKI
jgi:hypothetical protein